MARKPKFDLSTPEGAKAYHEHLKVTTKRRRLYDHRCPECDTKFIGLATAVYCSRACQQRAYRYRNRKRSEAS